MRWVAGLVLLCLLLVGPPATRADSDDETMDRIRQVEELMRRLRETEEQEADKGLESLLESEGSQVLRIHNVADLTIRLTSFVHPNLHLRPAGAEMDEDAPLFGKAEEGEMFFSGVEELLDLISANVWPQVWEERGNSMWTSGPHALIVIAPEEVQKDVHLYLQELRRSLGRIVTVSVRVLSLDDAALVEVLGGARSAILDRTTGLRLLARAEAGQDMRLGHSVRLSGFNGQQVMLYRCAQQAFVQDYDVEVAEEAKISDPIVGVLQTGLTFDVRSTMRGEDMVIVDLRAQLAALNGEMGVFETRSGPVQKPDLSLVDFSTTVTVPVAGFALISGSNASGRTPWALMLSASVERVQSGEGGGR